MACEAQDLVDAAVAAGFNNLATQTLKAAVVQLLCQSRGVILHQTTNPTVDPDDTSQAVVLLQTTTQKLWVWNPVSLAWFQAT